MSANRPHPEEQTPLLADVNTPTRLLVSVMSDKKINQLIEQLENRLPILRNAQVYEIYYLITTSLAVILGLGTFILILNLWPITVIPVVAIAFIEKLCFPPLPDDDGAMPRVIMAFPLLFLGIFSLIEQAINWFREPNKYKNFWPYVIKEEDEEFMSLTTQLAIPTNPNRYRSFGIGTTIAEFQEKKQELEKVRNERLKTKTLFIMGLYGPKKSIEDTPENKSVLTKIAATDPIFDRKLVPMIFSYLSPQDEKKPNLKQQTISLKDHVNSP
jgi:hypothetical protein